MPAIPIHGMTTITTPLAPTPSTIPTRMVAPVPTHSTFQSTFTMTPLTISPPATSTLGTAKHTHNPEHTPTTTHNQALPATTSTLYTLPSTSVQTNHSTKMPATPTLGTTTLTLPQVYIPSTIPTSKIVQALTLYT